MRMKWPSTFKLRPSTVAIAGICFNLVVRAAILATTWGCLLLIAIVLNWVIHLSLDRLGASEFVEDLSLTIVRTYVVILGAAATLTSIKDIWSLTVAGVRDPSVNAQGGGKGTDDESEDEQERSSH